jgi:hypothetical protein
MSTRKFVKIRDRFYGKKYGLDMVCATGHQTMFFYTTSAQGDLGWSSRLAVKLWGSISCVGVNSRVEHSRARKYQHKQVFLRRFHLLNSRLFGRGLFMNRTDNIFFGKKG